MNEEINCHVEIIIESRNDHALRDALDEAIDNLVEYHNEINQAIHQAQRDAAFIHYCNTGKFPD
jgi:hypothetical protein